MADLDNHELRPHMLGRWYKLCLPVEYLEKTGMQCTSEVHTPYGIIVRESVLQKNIQSKISEFVQSAEGGRRLADCENLSQSSLCTSVTTLPGFFQVESDARSPLWNGKGRYLLCPAVIMRRLRETAYVALQVSGDFDEVS
jgi:hypothetical protein